MRNLMITIFVAISTLATTALGGSQASLDQLVDKLSNDNSVTMIYISPSLMKSLSHDALMDYNLYNIADKATSMRIFVCGSAASQNIANQYVQERLKMKPTPSLLTKIRNVGNDLEIYGIPMRGDSKKFSSVIFLSKKSENSRLMILDGEFVADDIATLTNTGSNSQHDDVVVKKNGSVTHIYPYYGPAEPIISDMENYDDFVEVEFVDPSRKLATNPLVSYWDENGNMQTLRAASKRLTERNAKYRFVIPLKKPDKRTKVIFYLDDRKYTRPLTVTQFVAPWH